MKKIFSIVTVIALIITLSACTKDTHRFYISAMDTIIEAEVRDTKKNANKNIKVIEDIYLTYHHLTDNFRDLPIDSAFKTNIYAINKRPGEKIEIDFELYEILAKAEEYRILTDGYFDVSIGKIIDLWKEVIQSEDWLEGNDITEAEWEELVGKIDAIEVQENAYTLFHEDGKYYIQLKNDQVKLDLGAFAKGYATQKAYEYLEKNKVKNFIIVAGGSSIYLGENAKSEDKQFPVGLINPNRQKNDGRLYGEIKVKNNSITSSGNNEQFFMYGDIKYHHLISTKTKYPMHYYHSLTMVTKDAGFADAITTAIFSMSPEFLESWVERVRETYDFEIIIFNYDNTINTRYMVDTEFELR